MVGKMICKFCNCVIHYPVTEVHSIHDYCLRQRCREYEYKYQLWITQDNKRIKALEILTEKRDNISNRGEANTL